MADRVKGITIEIGGDVTGLNKALAGTNKEIRNTQTQLKDVERLLKLDPKNTELLAQKQRLLADSVEETRSKLETLKTAEKQVQQQFAEGKVTQQQYDGLQREIAATEQSLKSLESAAKECNQQVSKVGQIGDAMQAAGSKMEAAGKKMLPVTGAIAAVGATSIAAMDNVDEGLDTIVQKTGATGAAAKELEAVYREVAAEVPGDFGDIGAAVGEINTRLDFTGEKLKTASADFLKFAKVNGMDVNTSVQLVTRAMGDAGIAADEYGSVLDMLTVAGQKSGISIDKLAENLAKYGAPMRALGIDTEHAIALFAGWEKAGVNTEIAFSGMKKAISNWGKAGKDSTVEFQKTVDAIKAAPDIANATSIAIDAFGAKAGPDLADAIRGGRFEVDEYIAALESAGGAVESTYGGIVDEVDDTQLAMQTAQLALHDFGETIAKTVGPILLTLAQKLQAVGDWFSNLDERGQKIVLTVLAVVAGIGPLLIILGKVSTGVSAIISVAGQLSGVFSTIAGTVIPVVKGAFSGLFNLIAANPIVAAIIAVIAIVALFGDQIQAILQKVDDFLQGVFMVDWTTVFGPGLGDAINAFFANIKNIWDAIKQIFDGIIDFIRGVFTGDWERAWEGVKKIFGGIFDGLIAIAKAPINGIIGILNGAISGINALIRGINKIKIDVPDWVPLLGGKTFGFNIPSISKIPYLAKGGILSSGSAVVGEAGPELLTMIGNKAMVQPLTNQTSKVANFGETTINVYGAPGQDVRELASIVADVIENEVQRREGVFA